MTQTILIAGASGVIGSAAVERFARLPGWQVIALSRRLPVVAADCQFAHLPVDLSDAVACRTALATSPEVTHLIYAAACEQEGLVEGWRDPATMALNGQMFANLIDPLADTGKLRHVSLLQGAKAYGAHVHPVSVPLREDGPRDTHPNFYWLHEDRLREASARSGFSFTIWRPQVLLGTAPGVAMNPVIPIGAYAAIARERGQTFAMPGGGNAILELVDAGLLAEAMAWAATARAAEGQTFNITNGDVFILRDAWPEIAALFGLAEQGTPLRSFADFFAQPESIAAWSAIASRHGLREPSLNHLLGQSHHYIDLLNGERIAGKARPVLLSTIKLRQAGFAGCRDSLSSLLAQLAAMTDLHLLPPLPNIHLPGASSCN